MKYIYNVLLKFNFIAIPLFFVFLYIRRFILIFRNIFNSKSNILALQSLAKRRNDDYAIKTGRKFSNNITMPKISISIVTSNSYSDLKYLLNSIIRQDYPKSLINIYFTDRYSNNKIIQELNNFNKVYKNIFLSISINLNIKKTVYACHDYVIRTSNSEYCLILNDPLKLDKHSISNLLNIVLADEKDTIASWELRQFPLEQSKHYDPVTFETNISSHKCILFRRSAYIKSGGYDPIFLVSSCETELSYRLRSYGYILKYIPSSIVYFNEINNLISDIIDEYINFIISNFIIRLRYGTLIDIILGAILLFKQLISQKYNVKKYYTIFLLIKNMIIKLIKSNISHGKCKKIYYPFYSDFSYELSRNITNKLYNYPISQANKLVSVIIRTYADRDFLLIQAVNSLINQSYKNIEIIVTEDGGNKNKNLIDYIDKLTFNKYKFKYISNSKIGRSVNGNRALEIANGDYITFLDDDDLFYHDHIELLTNSLLNNNGYAAAYSPGIRISTKISYASKIYFEKNYTIPKLLLHTWNYNELIKANFISISTVFKRELYEKRGGFDPEILYYQDWNLWLRYGYNNNFYYLPKCTWLFRTPSSLIKMANRHFIYRSLRSKIIDKSFKHINSYN
ncbi:MAG: glycosyltransferase [Deltaproteobacteria bacterium]|jgi:GT2 family glycosyltransferase|nr:glycosyltransferase [Deltaproteobacteria bacterium]